MARQVLQLSFNRPIPGFLKNMFVSSLVKKEPQLVKSGYAK